MTLLETAIENCRKAGRELQATLADPAYHRWLAQLDQSPMDRELFRDFRESAQAPHFFAQGVSIDFALFTFRSFTRTGENR